LTDMIQTNRMMDRVKVIHFVGIGGAGMSGIAEVLLQEGYQVTGSDISASSTTQHLTALGAEVMLGHHGDHIAKAHVVVSSSAITADNPEIIAAKKQRIPVVARAEMLAEIMRFRYGVAVAGTHGKTTTTSLIADVLTDGGLDPSYVIGGLLNRRGSNAYLGSNRILVVEADESDASFLHLQPMISIVTNIDADHMHTYNNDFSLLRDTFVNFLQHLPFYGLAVLCVDDPVVSSIIEEVARPTVTYGFDAEADVRAVDFLQQGPVSEFTVLHEKYAIEQRVRLNMPGRHNVQNALAAIAVGVELGLDVEQMALSLNQFSGIGRRFSILGDVTVAGQVVTFVDDYGHHPREVAVTVAAARGAWPKRRLVMVFQPHRYSRTVDMFDAFVRELSALDCLLVLPVYAAGEAKVVGGDSAALCRSIRQRGALDPILVTPEELPMVLENVLRDGDVVLAQGAGSVSKLARDLVEAYKV
jgi:UDP-N-acetylmuramate--alanine ligase